LSGSPAVCTTCPADGTLICLSLIQGQIHLGLEVCCETCEAELEVVNLALVEVDWMSDEPEEEREFLARW
jgi:hypothetical protein